MRLGRVVLTVLLLFSSAPVSASEYRYSQDRSTLSITVRHFNMVTIAGQFHEFTGSFVFDPQKVDQSKVDLRIKSESIHSGNEMRDRDFRSRNFFWVDKYPEMTFKSREFKDIQGLTFNIYGDLTIKDVTKEVVFKTTLLTPLPDVAPGKPVRFHTETYIRRKDYKLGTERFNPLMFVTNETLKISLDVEGQPET
jgi:polyisoprenoid-binding protein YceI